MGVRAEPPMTLDTLPEVTVSDDRRRIAVTWPDGRRVTAPAPWLYDNAESFFFGERS